MTKSPDDVLAALLRMSEGRAVLYVEDEQEIRSEIAEMLETLFTRVVTAENGVAGLERYRQEPFLLVITDINMPLMGGVEFIQAVQAVNPNQAFVVTSAYNDSTNLIPLINLGVGSFILKPLNWRVFLNLVYRELTSALASEEEARYQERLEKEVKARTEELQESQRQIARLQSAKDNMLSLISHELRTPLNGILGFIDLVRPAILDSEGLTFLGHIEESARRLERSTRKALDFSTLTTGKRVLHRELHRVDSLLAAAWEQFADRQGPDNRLAYRWTGGPEPTLYTDAELLVEVLKNLMENSAKYGGTQPVLEVSWSTTEGWDGLTLRDTGPGFPAALVPTLFQPFSTGNIMHHSEGMGLGLALVDIMMLTLGGRVEADNPAAGGAEVRLSFPHPKAR